MEQASGRFAQEASPSTATFLRARRERLKLAQKKVALVAGVSRGTLINLEKAGDGPQPEADTILAVGAALGLAIRDLRRLESSEARVGAIEVVGSPDACSRIVDAIADASGTDPEGAGKAAESYRAFILAWTRSRPALIAKATKDALVGIEQHLLPLLEGDSALDAAIIKFFSPTSHDILLKLADPAEGSPASIDLPAPEQLLSEVVTIESSAIPGPTRSEAAGRGADPAEQEHAWKQTVMLRERSYMLEDQLERTRQQLREAIDMRHAAQQQVAELRTRLAEVERMRNELQHSEALRAVLQHEVTELKMRLEKAGASDLAAFRSDMTGLRDDIGHLTHVMEEAAQLAAATVEANNPDVLKKWVDGGVAFGRLPVRLQASLLSGSVADYTSIDFELNGKNFPLFALVVRPDEVDDISPADLATVMGYWTIVLLTASTIVSAKSNGKTLKEIIEEVRVLTNKFGVKEGS